MAKLKNTLAIQQMLAGEHKTQNKISIAVPGKDEYSKIEVPKIIGSRWTDDEGKEWEQMDGWKRLVSIFDDLKEESIYKNCYKVETGGHCTKNNITEIRQDKQMAYRTGRCLDCQIAFEHKLKITGKYEQYEKQKIYENALAWLVEAEKDKETIKEQFRAMSYANPNGEAETWTDTKSFETRCAEIDAEFERFRNEYLDKIRDDIGLNIEDVATV